MFFRNFLKIISMFGAVVTLTACNGDQSPPAPAPAPPPPPPVAPGADVTISGTITFDRVPLNTRTNGLDYSVIRRKAARGVIVEAVDSDGKVLDSDVTDTSGGYSVSVISRTDVRIRARAKIVQTAEASWDVTVRDNTSSNAPYILSGGLTSSGTVNSTRDLNAASGWNGTEYSSTRAAGPFAILDSIFDAVTAFEAIDGSVSFPALQVLWSVNNGARDEGGIANGDVGTSFFSIIDDIPSIVILGAANNDTDEYDPHVIVHEFIHFFEAVLSRSDSIGGSHFLTDRLDPRVAHGEGLANALAAIILKDRFYRDSSGADQAAGFSINLENNTNADEGWFNEGSVGSIIYDIGDSDNDGVDVLSAGLRPIYTAMTSPIYRETAEATTIFTLLDALREGSSINPTSLDALATGQKISGLGADGAGETNDGGIPNVLPIYNRTVLGGSPVVVCSTEKAGDFNKLGNRAFVRFSVPTDQNVILTLARVSGATDSDPDFVLRRQGEFLNDANSFTPNTETLSRRLTAGEYLVEAREFSNISSTAPGRDVCFNFTAR